MSHPFKITLLISAASLLLIGCTETPSGPYDAFAQCLTDKGAKMYGADWCPHCQDQKELFQGSFEKATYINCDFKKEECNAAGIEGYPTWILENGDRLTGTQPLEILSEKTSCPLPELRSEVAPDNRAEQSL